MFTVLVSDKSMGNTPASRVMSFWPEFRLNVEVTPVAGFGSLSAEGSAPSFCEVNAEPAGAMNFRL